MAAFEVFHSFYSEEDALAMLRLLTEKGIDCRIEKTKQITDKIIIGDGMAPPLHIKMAGADFTKAHEIIDQEVRENISALDADYYLYSFSHTLNI